MDNNLKETTFYSFLIFKNHYIHGYIIYIHDNTKKNHVDIFKKYRSIYNGQLCTGLRGFVQDVVYHTISKLLRLIKKKHAR